MSRAAVLAVAAVAVVATWFAENAAIHAAGFSGFAGAGWITAVMVPVGAGGWVWDKLNHVGTPPQPSARTRPAPPRLTLLPREPRPAMAPEARLATLFAAMLLGSMFLPWYGETVTQSVFGTPRAATFTRSAFGAFSLSEGAVLVLACSVLGLLFAGAARLEIHIPGGLRAMTSCAGVLTTVLILYRMLDQPGPASAGQATTAVSLRWGIFLALACAIGLTFAGSRIRTARQSRLASAADPRQRMSRTATPRRRE
jgi:hypothetical protein